MGLNKDSVPPIPLLDPGDTPEEALALLAGAIDAAITLYLNSPSSDQQASDEWMTILVAFKQYQDAGFEIEAMEKIRDNILAQWHEA